jgi:hypothetical protein
MKHFMTALACLFIMNVSAQFPYNPDSDANNLININDVLDFLPLFGDEFYPEPNLEDSIPVIDMYPFIVAHYDTISCCGVEFPTVTIDGNHDKLVLTSSLQTYSSEFNCDNSCTTFWNVNRLNIEIEEPDNLYHEILIIWATTYWEAYNIFGDPAQLSFGSGMHFKLIYTENGWIGPVRFQY